MALFPNIEIEGEVQVNDRTRFSGIKSYVSKGAADFAIMTIQPGLDATAISVFNADEDQRYLDWEFSTWNCDIVAENKYIDFSEGGTAKVATLTEDTYTLSELADEIESAMNSAGSNTYTVAVGAGDKITISSSGQFALLPVSGESVRNGLLKHVGFLVDTADSVTSVTGKQVDYLQKQVTIYAEDATTPTANNKSSSKLIKVLSEDGDKLFSSDEELTALEPEILKWVTPGRNTFKDVHRRCQKNILTHLDEEGYVDVYDKPYTKSALVSIEEVRPWATYMAMRLIFEGIHNSKEDVFAEKARTYMSEEIKARNRMVLRIDVDDDGKIDTTEGLNSFSGGRLSRR
jgi:hypothetical protein